METFPYDRSALLTLDDSEYVLDLERFVGSAYDSDTADGDVTTEALSLREFIETRLIAKSDGVFCGVLEMEWLLKRVAPSVQWKLHVSEGALFMNGDLLVEFEGNSDELLKVERTLLNVLQRLCGISTMTADLVVAADPCRVAATRKTLYGRLDKRAVAVGGGLTHRLILVDAPMFKDTHFDGVDRSWERIVEALTTLSSDLPFVTIEVRKIDRLSELIGRIPSGMPWPIFLLLDNFAPADLQEALQTIDRPLNVFFEASGGISADTVSAYSKTGVEVLSVGALTHTVQPADLSMVWG